jgi:hypothetical protein
VRDGLRGDRKPVGARGEVVGAQDPAHHASVRPVRVRMADPSQ